MAGDNASMKTYALGITTDEAYLAMINKKMGNAIRAISRIQGFVGVHPKERMQIFLYLTPKARSGTARILRTTGFKSVMIIERPAFVPINLEAAQEGSEDGDG